MNIKKLFNKQKILDENIIKKRGIEGKDLLPGKILALRTEIGELANEQQTWKFWKKDPKPRTLAVRKSIVTARGKEYYNPLLDEYVDGLSFILGIGLELYNQEELEIIADDLKGTKRLTLVDQFNTIYFYSAFVLSGKYTALFEHYIGLGEMLGFSWEDIETAYLIKNQINHLRQEEGY